MAQADLDLVRAFYAALRRLDLAEMFDALDPGVQLRHPTPLPWGGDERGYAGVRRFLERLVLSVDARFDVTEILDTGDTIVAGQFRGRVRATGAPFDVRFVHIWTTSEGRLTRLDAHLDTAALLHTRGDQGWFVPSATWTTASFTPRARRPRHGRTRAIAAPSRAVRRVAISA